MFDEGVSNHPKDKFLSISRPFLSDSFMILLGSRNNNCLQQYATRRGYDTWDEGRKKPLPTIAKNPDPTLNSACSNRQLTRGDNTDRSAVVFLAAEAPTPDNLGGRAGSKSKSQQHYDKDGLLKPRGGCTTVPGPRAGLLISSLANVCLNVARTHYSSRGAFRSLSRSSRLV